MTTTLLVQAKGDHRLATALHEAGHAVAYLALGKPFSHMEIDGVSDHVGQLAVATMPCYSQIREYRDDGAGQ